jgi:hypothetical protein
MSKLRASTPLCHCRYGDFGRNSLFLSEFLSRNLNSEFHENRQTFQSPILRHSQSERRTEWRDPKIWRLFVLRKERLKHDEPATLAVLPYACWDLPCSSSSVYVTGSSIYWPWSSGKFDSKSWQKFRGCKLCTDGWESHAVCCSTLTAYPALPYIKM